jgi:2'-5' RNA ligase
MIHDFQLPVMKRLFCAIKIYPDSGFINKYRQMKEAFRHEKIKWVEEYNIHVTLKFFGETVVEKIPDIASVLEKTARETQVFEIALRGVGIFGSSYEPRVIWTGIEPYRDLREIMIKLQEKLRIIGYEPERQNMVPHLTLGRIKYLKDKTSFRRILDDFRDISSGMMSLDSFILYESILRKEGPEYISLQAFHFHS